MLKSLNLTKIEHIANIKKLQYYVDLKNRNENKLEVKMLGLQINKEMSYEKEINDLKEKYNIDMCLTGNNTKAIKNYIKNKIKEVNDKEVDDEIKKGKKTKMMSEYRKNYIEELHFEEARAIFMMLTRMIDVKTNFKNNHKNLECETCKTEENTHHLFKCTKYQDLSKNIKGETLQSVIKNNKEIEVANALKEIIKRRELEREEKQKTKQTTAPLPMGLSLPDGRE